MNLLQISIRNLRVRALSAVLTGVGIAVGTGLLAALWLLMGELERGYTASIGGAKAIVGSKDSSPMQIVMSTVLNLGDPQGVVKLETYLALRRGELGPRARVLYAIPQARGDTYSHYRFPIIGTTDEMFSEFEIGGKDQHLEFAAGEPWDFGHQDLMEFARRKAAHAAQLADPTRALHGTAGTDGGARSHLHELEVPASWKRAVVGAKVASLLELSVGDVIVPVHGKAGMLGAHQHERFGCAVAGVLAPTGSPLDRSIYIPLGTFLSMGDHVALRETAGAEAGDVLLTAIICKPLDRVGGRVLELTFQTRADGQVAVPAKEIPRLMRIVGTANQALALVALLVLAVAAISVAVSLYNTMNERRREIAIMRSLGARRLQVISVILQEAVLISLAGAVVGVAACHAAALAFGAQVERLAGVAVHWTSFSVAELWLILGVAVLGGVAGVLPALKGSLTPVAENLGQTS